MSKSNEIEGNNKLNQSYSAAECSYSTSECLATFPARNLETDYCQQQVTLDSEQLEAARSYNQFFFSQQSAIEVLQDVICTNLSGEIDDTTCNAIANYQSSNNNIEETDGKLNRDTIDEIIRLLVIDGRQEDALVLAVDFFNLNELNGTPTITYDSTIDMRFLRDENNQQNESYRFGNESFENGLDGLENTINSCFGTGVTLNSQVSDVIEATTNGERQTAVWSNIGAENEGGLANWVRDNFPSEADLGNYLQRNDIDQQEKIAAIGNIQVAIGRLEYLLGIIYHGGNDQSWENQRNNLNNNRGTFVNYFKSTVGNRTNGLPWCTMFAGYLKRMTGFENDLSTGGPLIFNSGARLNYWASEGRNFITGRDDFSDPSDYENYSGSDISRSEWIGLRRRMSTMNQEQKEVAIDSFFEDRITPQAGDIMVINTQSTNNSYGDGFSSHTLTVESYNNHVISTIEGNRGPHRLTGVELDLREDIGQVISLVRIGTEFYTENEEPSANDAQNNPISVENILNPLNHMIRNLQLIAGHLGYLAGDSLDAGATVAEMSPEAGNGTR